MPVRQIPKKPGHVGYPMVMACCSGIELLGSLLSDKPFQPENGADYFKLFWSRDMCPGRDRLVEPFYQLLRHGLAHAFVTGPGVVVVKHYPEAHLTFQGRQLSVDCTTLSNDLMKSFPFPSRSSS
jgi:hypothetical protein